MKRKIIFDLDDTLYIDKCLRSNREKAILRFLGERVGEYEILKKNRCGTIESFKLLGFSREDFFRIIKEVEINIEIDEKLIAILEKLKEDYELVVLSNSPRESVIKTLDKLGVLYKFDRIYSGEDFTREKPADECFFMVEKNDICIGNSFRKDLEIPKKNGAKTILIGKEGLADYCINSIYEIIYAIEHLSTA